MSASPAIRLLSVEDHPVFFEGLRLILESQEDMALVGHATTVAAAIGQFADARPDVVLLDLRLPDTQGTEGVLAVRKQFPEARVIVLTTVDQDGDIQHTLQAGAAAYVLKSSPKSEILAAIRSVHAGRKHITAAVAARLAERLGEEDLTPRELQVLGFIRDGLRNKQVADELGISETTVNFHIKNIVEKLQAKDRTHALVIALRRGLLPMRTVGHLQKSAGPLLYKFRCLQHLDIASVNGDQPGVGRVPQGSEAGVSDLLELALQAHGGLDRWRQVQALDLRLSISGALYKLKGFPEGLPSAVVRVDTSRPAVTILPYLVANARGRFTPDRVWIEDADGKVLDERASPRASFAGHSLRTPWDQLQRLYFTGYAVWNYLTLPYLLAGSRFASHELEPHRDNGDVWRRLQVTFPPEVPTHCAEQTLYFDPAGRLQRLDYAIDIAGATVAHYCYDHAVVSGLVFPTLHRVVRRTSAGPQLSGPTGVLLQLQVSNFIAW